MADKEKLAISFIIPIYNRPVEMVELMESMVNQTNKDFEVVVVEDGSDITCKKEVERFSDKLNIKYFFKENTGPGISRNYGFERASGNYCIFLDSDCVLPPQYFDVVQKRLQTDYVDAFGGPDREDESFTTLQKAISYSMTSFLTTGGIRGGGEQLDKFYPRSFNMGISREVYNSTGGFPSARFASAKAAGEDIELSANIRKKGFTIGLFKEAYVFHKRRTDLRQFLRQVYNFGYARISIHKRNVGALKFVHFLPSLFTLGFITAVLLAIFVSWYFAIPLILITLLFFVDATIRNKSIIIGTVATLTSYIQLFGYGFGFMEAFWKGMILKQDEYGAFGSR